MSSGPGCASVLINERLRDSELHTALREQVKVFVEGGEVMGGGGGCVDVLVTGMGQSTLGCVYLCEMEVAKVASSLEEDRASVNGRLTALAKTGHRGLVLAVWGANSEKSWNALQTLAVLRLHLSLIPVTSATAAANQIAQIVKVKHSAPSHYSRPSSSSGGSSTGGGPVDLALVSAVQCLPKTGGVKARTLLDRFGSLKKISEATVEDLSPAVGPTSASAIFSFFRHSASSPS